MTTTSRAEPVVLTVANLKGGSGKTTTAAYVLHALHERGLRVLGVDADHQMSLLRWHETASFPFPVVGQPSGKLHREVHGIAGDQFDVVVIDTPPTEHGRPIALSALRVATHALIPVAPAPIEYERLRGLVTLVEEAAELRPDEQPPTLGALLVRTVAGAGSTDRYRQLMSDDGWPVLAANVPRREGYAQSFGEPVFRARATGYGDAVAELLRLPQVPSPVAHGAPREVFA